MIRLLGRRNASSQEQKYQHPVDGSKRINFLFYQRTIRLLRMQKSHDWKGSLIKLKRVRPLLVHSRRTVLVVSHSVGHLTLDAALLFSSVALCKKAQQQQHMTDDEGRRKELKAIWIWGFGQMNLGHTNLNRKWFSILFLLIRHYWPATAHVFRQGL